MSTTTTRNRLLLSLPAAIRQSLLSVGRICTFGPGTVMPAPAFVHFIESGSVSLLMPGSSFELAALGTNGMLGYEAAFDACQPLYPVHSHKEWTTLAVPAETFRSQVTHAPALRQLGLRYPHALAAHFAEGAGASGQASVRTRLARRLLIAADHLGDEIDYTQQALADLLGARRPSVTVGLHELEGEHFIRARRGRVRITDRPGLETRVGGIYGLANRVFDELFPIDPGAAAEELHDEVAETMARGAPHFAAPTVGESRPVFHHFFVTAVTKSGPKRMGLKHAADVDIYVARLAENGVTDITVQDLGGTPKPYRAWRAERPEPRARGAFG